MDRAQYQQPTNGWRKDRQNEVGLARFRAIGAFLLITEHRAHLSFLLIAEHRGHLAEFVYYLPLVVLACPLMHLFMHGGHGDHGAGHAHKPAPHEKGDTN